VDVLAMSTLGFSNKSGVSPGLKNAGVFLVVELQHAIVVGADPDFHNNRDMKYTSQTVSTAEVVIRAFSAFSEGLREIPTIEIV
jgi:hypothetical protein